MGPMARHYARGAYGDFRDETAEAEGDRPAPIRPTLDPNVLDLKSARGPHEMGIQQVPAQLGSPAGAIAVGQAYHTRPLPMGPADPTLSPWPILGVYNG